VSTDPAHATDVRAAAAWVATRLESAGPFTVRTLPTAGNPVVYAEWLGARGVSDDKGPMLIPILVAEAFFETAGALPVNVKCLFEGEEEVGSPSLDAF